MHRLLTILLVCILVSCSDKTSKISSVEFIGFNWSHLDSLDKQIGSSFLVFNCRSYAIIDNQGKTKVSLYGRAVPYQLQNLLIQLNPKIIKKLELIATERNREMLDSLYNLYINPIEMPGSYEGPNLKVRLNYDNGNSFIFNFIEDEKIFQMFPPLRDFSQSFYGLSVKATGKFNDTTAFNESRLNFIKSTIQNDTCFDIRYKLPIRILLNKNIVYGDSIFKMN